MNEEDYKLIVIIIIGSLILLAIFISILCTVFKKNRDQPLEIDEILFPEKIN